MATKRPYSSEGRLALPARIEGARRRSAGPPVLEVPDDGLAPFGIRRGDRVLLTPGVRTLVEHGDIVVAPDAEGVARLWKAYPEREGLRLTRGDEQITLPSNAPTQGVVVAILRPLDRT